MIYFRKHFLFLIAFVLLVFFIIFYIIEIIFGKFSILNIHLLNEQKQVLKDEILRQEEKNALVKMKLDSISNDPESLETYARREMNLVKEGEILLEIREPEID